MHIPKTAGTSVSRLFIDYFGEATAIEQCTQGIYVNRDFNTLDFVSGHATLASARGRFDGPFYSFTLLRDPIEQLISHLNWVKRLLRPEYRQDFEQHAGDIQQVALSLAAVDLSDAEAVDRYLTRCEGKARQLFLNAQTRYFLPPGRDCSRGGLDVARESVSGLGQFDTVGRLEDAARVIARVATDNGLGALGPLPRTNVSQNKVTLQGGEPARRLLEPYMQLDILLYEIAGQRVSEFRD